MARWGRGPRLLEGDDLPPGFLYPPELRGLIAGPPLRHWEWLVDARLRAASKNLWKHHPRTLVPVAVRRDTTFVVCLDATAPGPGGFDVVTLDALDPEAVPAQHLPDLTTWVASARGEEAGPTPSEEPARAEVDPDHPGEPGDPDAAGEVDPAAALGVPPWSPRETGRCACVFHLDDVALSIVPFGADVIPGTPSTTVGDLLLRGGIEARPDYPGPPVALGKRQVLAPFHWRATLSPEARQHYDDDGRVSLDQWLMPNPGVGLVIWPERGDLLISAPDLCRDGVLTLVARALLDDRVRRGRRARRR